MLVLIEYVPFGDLLGYLRKSRGLNDTYYKDPDIKPQINLTSQELVKFAWQIADGMSYLSSKFVSSTKKEQENKQQSKFSYNISLWGVPSWWDHFLVQCNFFKRLCLRGANVCLKPNVINYFFSFLKLGSAAIVVHHRRLPYPRLKLFSFPLISFSVVDFHLLLQRWSK